MIRRLAQVLAYRPAVVVALAAGAVYLGLFLFSIGDLQIGSKPLVERAPDFVLVEGWPSRMIRQRVAFTFEPIAAIYFTTGIALMVSPINLLLGLSLSSLLGLNLGFLLFAVKRPQACPVASKKGLLFSVPGLLLGFGCCAPTLLLALGSAAASLTLSFIAVRTVLFPLAIAGMIVTLLLNLRRVQLPGRSVEELHA